MVEGGEPRGEDCCRSRFEISIIYEPVSSGFRVQTSDVDLFVQA